MNAITPVIWSMSDQSWRVDMAMMLCRGVSIAEACRELGISRARYYRHVNADPVFRMQMMRARTSVDVQLLRVIMESGNWRAAAWYLEKSDPRSWGPVKTRLRLEKCTCGAADYVD